MAPTVIPPTVAGQPMTPTAEVAADILSDNATMALTLLVELFGVFGTEQLFDYIDLCGTQELRRRLVVLGGKGGQ